MEFVLVVGFGLSLNSFHFIIRIVLLEMSGLMSAGGVLGAIPISPSDALRGSNLNDNPKDIAQAM